MEWAPLENHADSGFVTPGSKPGVGEKREQNLMEAFQNVLKERGHTLGRLRITPPEGTRPLYSDICDATDVWYEAKAEATRNHVRLGLRQIWDYRRFASAQVQSYALLLLAQPQHDLLELLQAHDVDTV